MIKTCCVLCFDQLQPKKKRKCESKQKPNEKNLWTENLKVNLAKKKSNKNILHKQEIKKEKEEEGEEKFRVYVAMCVICKS